MDWNTIIAALIASGAASAIIAAFERRRQNSAAANKTDAETEAILGNEYRMLIAELRRGSANAEAKLGERIAALQADMAALARDNHALREELTVTRAENIQLRKRVTELEARLNTKPLKGPGS